MLRNLLHSASNRLWRASNKDYMTESPVGGYLLIAAGVAVLTLGLYAKMVDEQERTASPQSVTPGTRPVHSIDDRVE